MAPNGIVSLIKNLGKRILRRLGRKNSEQGFPGTVSYWETRYAEGRTSGSGSYGQLAEFKARIINQFVRDKEIRSVIEFGCGDGNQLSLGQYPSYVGLDVSPSALAVCITKFRTDSTKSFYLYHNGCFADNAHLFKADLALSLDVLFHLIEPEIWNAYLQHLFAAACRYVIIYASDFDAAENGHERRRCFTKWVKENQPEWELLKVVKNEFPYDPAHSQETSLSDFYFYEKKERSGS